MSVETKVKIWLRTYQIGKDFLTSDSNLHLIYHLHLFVTNPSYFLHTSQSYFKCDLIQDPWTGTRKGCPHRRGLKEKRRKVSQTSFECEKLLGRKENHPEGHRRNDVKPEA